MRLHRRGRANLAGRGWASAWLRGSPSTRCSPTPCPPPPHPLASLPAQDRPDGGSREMPLSCTLLVYFEKPPVSSAAWGHVVAAGLSHGRDSEPDRVLPWLLAPSPFLPRGLSPHILTPSSGTTPSARRGKGQVPKGGFGWGLIICWQYGESGELGLAPPLSGLSPCPPRPPLLQAWPLVAISILRPLAAVITAGVVCWVESSVVPYTAPSRVTSGACRQTATQSAGPARRPDSPLACCLAGLNCPSHPSRNLGAALASAPAPPPPCTEL